MKLSRILFIVGAVMAFTCFVLNSHQDSDFVYGGVGIDISNFLFMKVITFSVLVLCGLMIILEGNDEPNGGTV